MLGATPAGACYDMLSIVPSTRASRAARLRASHLEDPRLDERSSCHHEGVAAALLPALLRLVERQQVAVADDWHRVLLRHLADQLPVCSLLVPTLGKGGQGREGSQVLACTQAWARQCCTECMCTCSTPAAARQGRAGQRLCSTCCSVHAQVASVGGRSFSHSRATQRLGDAEKGNLYYRHAPPATGTAVCLHTMAKPDRAVLLAQSPSFGAAGMVMHS